jgi:hypothetical protein
MTTELYKKELNKYEATDPYGIPYRNSGYCYHTPTQLAGINNRPFAVMDYCSAAYREIATREFQKLLDLNADGWLFDEVCTHSPAIYSFSPDHGYNGPGYLYAGDIPLARQLRTAANKVNSEYLFAGEGPQDWLTQYYPLSYFRGSATPVERYISPHAPIMVAVNGFDDREQLNLILRNRYIISYEPYNFKGHLSDFPLTLAYGRKIDLLRRKYREYLWDAEFRDTLGAKVEVAGRRHSDYSVFVRKDGRRAAVVVNTKRDEPINAIVTFEHESIRPLVCASPEQPDAQPCGTTLTVAPRSVIVLMER